MKMVRNVGRDERILRIVVGIALLILPERLGLPFWATGVGYLLGVIGLFTGLIGFCPAWKVFGINTCRKNSPKKSGT